ncbi:MAG: DUF3489 domain-containing protein [Acetobacteraceae bacterium]|nr:DUF3489 domain-containing protein [Acetobacteraceae bacterium]
MTLSPTQAALLAAAQQHPQRLVAPPERLPPAPRDAIRKSLLAKGLIEPAAADDVDDADPAMAWSVDGAAALYRITEAGLAAMEAATAPAEAAGTAEDGEGASEPAEASQAPQDAAEAPQAAPARPGLRAAAQAVLAAWDAPSEGAMRAAALDQAITSLRAALSGRPSRAPRPPGAPRQPREGTKQQQVLTLLRRPEGATVAQIAEATGWQTHTVRGFFAGLRKRHGVAVEAAERVRQVGAGRQGSKGSFTVYRIGDAG